MFASLRKARFFYLAVAAAIDILQKSQPSWKD
jgi:hypothetical protein